MKKEIKNDTKSLYINIKSHFYINIYEKQNSGPEKVQGRKPEEIDKKIDFPNNQPAAKAVTGFKPHITLEGHQFKPKLSISPRKGKKPAEFIFIFCSS